MKKTVFLTMTAFMLFVFCSCSTNFGINNKIYQDVKVDCQWHDNIFIYNIEHKRADYGYYYTKISIDKAKDEFFGELKSNQYYLEEYDEDTLLFYKEKENNSAYYIVKYEEQNENKYIYSFNSSCADIHNNDKNYGLDFPYYILNDYLTCGEKQISCGFDYIKTFYSRLSYEVAESGNDYIIINLYEEKNVLSDAKMRIDKVDDNTINLSMIGIAGET